MTHNQRRSTIRVRWRQWAERQPVLALLLSSGLAGAAAAALLTAGLILLDIGGLGTLMVHSDVGALAAACLLAVMTITIVSASMGTAIMGIGRDDKDDHPQGGRRIRVPVRIPDRRRGRF